MDMWCGLVCVCMGVSASVSGFLNFFGYCMSKCPVLSINSHRTPASAYCLLVLLIISYNGMCVCSVWMGGCVRFSLK